MCKAVLGVGLLRLSFLKAASDIFAPMSGRVVEINNKLEDDPALINKQCYTKGWIAKIEIKDMEETGNLMTADDYRSYLDTLDH